MKDLSQQQMVFYKLLMEWRKDKEKYIPAFEFVGEMFIEELNKWVLLSYKCPTRLTEIYQDNPDLFQRTEITGKSGATYYGYRIVANPSPELIKDSKLLKFYNKIRILQRDQYLNKKFNENK